MSNARSARRSSKASGGRKGSFDELPNNHLQHQRLKLQTKVSSQVFYLNEEGIDYTQERALLSKLKLPKFDIEPFYYKADIYNPDSVSHKLGAQINQQIKPNLNGLLETCIGERHGHLFELGMWVEYLNDDMQWVFGIISKIAEIPPDNWNHKLQGDPNPEDCKIFYSIGDEVHEENHIRAPTQALHILFGKRPWLWQQFTVLQLERRLRKDRRHEYDFEEMDMTRFASDRFQLWLEASENRDFKLVYDQQPEIARNLLLSHVLSPFKLCDEIKEDESRWNFDDPEISVYTYTSVLGSGLFISLTTVCIQIISILVLMYTTAFFVDGDPNGRFTDVEGSFFPETSLHQFCAEENQNERKEGEVLLFIVLWIHALALNPDAVMRWVRNVAGGTTTFSRMNALRRSIYTKQEDTIVQEIGFNFDMIMNGVYIPLLYLCITFILIQTPNVLDIILNALAINYIHEIDELIASSDWWDLNKRWIRAGTIELVLQDTLLTLVINNQNKLCAVFEIDPDALREALGDGKALKHVGQAVEDDTDFIFMTEKERADRVVAIEAEKVGNKDAINEYKKAAPQFSFVDKLMAASGIRKSGLFARYKEYRCWSRWERVLFLPRVPEVDEAKTLLDIHQNAALKVTIGSDTAGRFRDNLIFVLTGRKLIEDLRVAVEYRRYLEVPNKFIFGIVEIVSYLIQLIAPLLIFPGMFVLPLCY